MQIFKAAALGVLLTSALATAAFAKGGGKDFYCSYQRLPNRVCTTDSNGNERCKIQGWTLRQHCY
jgi:hypothetical protein